MPITQAGIALTPQTPKNSRPPPHENDPIQTMEQIGRTEPRAREATDGTRWCRCCERTAPAGPTSAFCPNHAKTRNLFLKKLRRQEAAALTAARAEVAAQARPAPPPDGMLLVETEALVHLVRMTNMMSTHVMRASEHYQALGEPVWLDNLMLSAKNLDAAIQHGICNGRVLPVTRVPAAPQQRESRTRR